MGGFKPTLAEEQELCEAGGESHLKSVTITFPQGSRVIAVSGKPDAARAGVKKMRITTPKRHRLQSA